MIVDGRVLGLPLVDYNHTKANIEALTGLEVGMTAFATDTEQWGYYDGAAWQWFGEPGDYLQATDIDTLAELNAIVGDATLDDTGDPRAPTDHGHSAPGDGGSIAHSVLTGVGTADHHARYTDAEAESVADTQIATHAADDDAHHAVFVPEDIDTLAELNAIVADATLVDVGDTVPITRIIGAASPVTVTPADGVLDEDLEIGISSATTGAEGAVELATTAEAQDGTDTSRAVTPAGLRADAPATPAASRGVRLDASGDLILPGDVTVPDGGFVGISGADGWTFDSTNGDVTTTSKVGIGSGASNPSTLLYLAKGANTNVHLLAEVPSDNTNLVRCLIEARGQPVRASAFRLGDGTNYWDMRRAYNLGGTIVDLSFMRDENERMRITSGGNVGINEPDPDYKLDVGGDANVTGVYRVDDTQVVTNRQTGWGAPTGTATRTTFATGTVTLEDLAERVHALIDDLTTHGLIGA